MRFLLFTAFLLSACAAPSTHGPGLHQAAVRPAPPVRPPVMTPGYSPGTPAEPVFTPQGAGASRDRLPGASVPRSPNKRVLPATKEAGVWAADGASAPGEQRLTLFAIDLPMDNLSGPAQTALTSCAFEMTIAVRAAAQHAVFNYPTDARACMAVRALQHCAEVVRRGDANRLRASLPRDWSTSKAYKSASDHLNMLARKMCTTELTDEQEAVLKAITGRWEWETTKR